MIADFAHILTVGTTCCTLLLSKPSWNASRAVKDLYNVALRSWNILCYTGSFIVKVTQHSACYIAAAQRTHQLTGQKQRCFTLSTMSPKMNSMKGKEWVRNTGKAFDSSLPVMLSHMSDRSPDWHIVAEHITHVCNSTTVCHVNITFCGLKCLSHNLIGACRSGGALHLFWPLGVN